MTRGWLGRRPGGSHGQHCPGVHFHHDAHAAGSYMVLLHRIIQRIFKIMLNICIDGQPQPAALHGGKLGLVALRQRVAPSIHGGQHHSVLPGKGVVVFELQPADPGIVHVGEPKHRSQKLPLRYQRLES